MEWMKLSGNIPSLSLISLGTFYNNKYYVSNECLNCLREINAKLIDKGPHTYSLRRALIFMDIFNKDLIPILIHVDQPNIIRSTIKLLVQMTLTVGCLVSGETATNQRNATPSESRVFVHELSQFLYNAKETFALNPLATRSIFEHLNCLLANVPQRPLSKDDCESVSYFLLLIRNIVHAPERYTQSSAPVGENTTSAIQHQPAKAINNDSSSTVGYWQQRRLLWDLFSQGFDLLLIDLLNCSPKDEWVVTIAQLITLIFKDHSAEKIQNLLLSKPVINNDAVTSLPSSSDDDTDSGHCSQTSSYNSATETVTETNDSASFYWTPSDSTGTTAPMIKKLKNDNMGATEIQTEIPESGYQKRNKILTSRRHQAIARHIQMKVKIQNYTPSEDEISRLLKEFTVDFLMNGYNTLVAQLYKRLLQHQDALPMFDKSYFFWLISYFLPIASHLEMDIFKQLNDVISVDIISYLTWELARESEEFEMNSPARNSRESVDQQLGLRRMHLGLKAMRECLQTLEAHFSRITIHQGGDGCRSVCEDTQNVYKLRNCLADANDLRQLLLLQLRQFNPRIQSKKYLCDVITTNQLLLQTLERATKQPPSAYKTNFDFHQHMKQFCSKTTLRRYGLALEEFKTNDLFVNDCIFTLLHHVGINLGHADLLCDPVILRPFGKIWEEEFNVCEEWNDLIELAINKFMRHYEANGCQAMKSADQVVPSSGEFKNPANPALLQPHIKIESLLDQLVKSGFRKQLDWIQSSLLTACSARLGTYAGQEFRHAMICLSLKMNVSCPIVPWTELEASALRSPLFLCLLHRVGLFPNSRRSFLYPRIPHKWTSDILYSVALLFGPVHQERVDFVLSRVTKINLLLFANSKMDQHSDNQPSQQQENSASYNGDELTSVESTAMKRSDSLEVQKHDSSDDDEMEDSESSARLTILSGTTPVLGVPLNWSVHPDMGRQLSNDGEETFRMGSIRCEISRMPFGKNA